MKTCRVSDHDKQKINLNKNVLKLVAKLCNYRFLFKDIRTFLELDYYGDSLLIIVYIVVLGIMFPKI